MIARVYYLSTSLRPNEVKYVGVTISSLRDRLKKHLKMADEGVHKLHNKFHRNYNWIVEMIDKGEEILINEIDSMEIHKDWNSKEWEWLERYWISQMKAWGFKLNNMTSGGLGNKDQIFSEEAKRKRVAKRIGVPLSPEHRLHVSMGLKGRTYSETVLTNITRGIREAMGIKILQYDLEGNFIKKWDSINEAAESLGTRCCTIANYLKSEVPRNSCKGYQWRYENDPRPVNRSKKGKGVTIYKYDKYGNLLGILNTIQDIAKECDVKEWKIRRIMKEHIAFGYKDVIYLPQ